MKLDELLTRLAEYQKKAQDRGQHPDSFRLAATALIDLEADTPEDADAARFRLDQLVTVIAVPLEQVSRSVDTASGICRDVGRRLNASPGVQDFATQWPAPVAHELQSLIEALQGRKLDSGHLYVSPEAALLQLRDLGESMMRLPVVALCMAVFELGGAPAQECIHAMLVVSGGSWLSLGGKAAIWLLNAKPSHPLATLARLFEPSSKVHQGLTSLVAGRNDHIGHAGVRPDPVETAEIVRWQCLPDAQAPRYLAAAPRRPTPALLPLLELAAAARPWQGLELQVGLPSGQSMPLMGAQALQGWMSDQLCHHHDGHALPLRLHLDGQALPLSPWVSARQCSHCGRRDVFVFDNWYQSDKADLQDYGRGHKLRMALSADAQLALWRQQALVTGKLETTPTDAAALSTLNSAAALALLDRHSLSSRYTPPTYLRDGLRDFLATQNRGVYWLQAPAHVGKTLFSRGLADPALEPDGLSVTRPDGRTVRWVAQRNNGADECGVAAFFCKKAYRESGLGFLNAIGPALVQALDIAREQAPLLPAPQDVARAPQVQRRQAFAQFVEGYRQASARPTQPLLIVIDGLDEAEGPGSPDSLCHLLPGPGDLPEGVYILLTSRRVGDADCPIWLDAAMQRMRPAGLTTTASGSTIAWCRRVLDLADDGYRGVMFRHVQAQLGRQGPDDEVLNHAFEHMLQAAQDLFVYVSFIAERIRLQQLRLEDLATLPQGEQLYTRYLDELPLRHGAKLADGMYQVLATLAAAEQAYEWLFTPEGEISDISQLEPDARTTWIQSLLRGEAPRRVDSAPLLSMGERDWPGLDLQVLAEMLAADDASTAGIHAVDARLVLLLILVQGTLGVWRGASGHARYRLGLKGFGEQIRRHPPLQARVQQQTQALTQWLVEALAAWAAAEPNSAAEADREHLLRPTLALLPGAVALGGASDTPTNCWQRAHTICRMWRSQAEEATSHREAASLSGLKLQFLLNPHARISPTGLATGVALGWRSFASSLLEQHELLRSERASTFEAEIWAGISEFLGPNLPLEFLNNFAQALVGRGNARRRRNSSIDAIADYSLAIKLREGCIDASGDKLSVDYVVGLATTFLNRGNAHQDCNSLTEAIADFNMSISLRESLRTLLGQDPELLEGLAGAYMNRGNALLLDGKLGKAISDYDIAIKLREEVRVLLGDQWRPRLRTELAKAYNNRGLTRQRQNQSKANALEAIADHDVAIELGEALRVLLCKDWPPDFAEDLAAAYANRGAAKLVVPALEEAIRDLDKSIEIRELVCKNLGANWSPILCDELAASYLIRGTAHQNNNLLSQAILDYGEAVRLRETIRPRPGEHWRPYSQNRLASAYMNRGFANMMNNSSAAAIADLDVVIELRQGLRNLPSEDWRPDFQDGLIGAYLMRGINYLNDGALKQAIRDLDLAVELGEELRELRLDQWAWRLRGRLGKAYHFRAIARESADDLSGAESDRAAAKLLEEPEAAEGSNSSAAAEN